MTNCQLNTRAFEWEFGIEALDQSITDCPSTESVHARNWVPAGSVLGVVVYRWVVVDVSIVANIHCEAHGSTRRGGFDSGFDSWI